MGETLDRFQAVEPPLNNIEKKIIRTIKKESRPISKRKLAKLLKTSPATAGKYVDILVAKGKLHSEPYGNIHLISLRGEQ